MSTTDTRAAFEAWHKEKFGYVDLGYSACDDAEKRWEGYQAATEAAKATGTGGGPDAFMVIQGGDEPVSVHFQRVNAKISAKKFAAAEIVPLYRAEAARHDKDGNHADDLRGMLDELQTEFDKQQSAFWACSEKLAQVQRNQETELSDIRILELAEEDFGEQDGRNVKNEALLSFARRVQAARQPAPVVAVKPWEARMQEYFAQGSVKMRTPASFMADEIIDSRAALAATAAPVRNEADERDNEIFELQKALAFWLPQVNQFMSDEMSQRIAHDAYMLVIDGNLPDDFKTAQELGWILPATGEFQGDAEMVCGNCMEPIAATNRSQP